jgi:CubicO group peptidase (beta-lactamase class C family)
MTLAEATAFAAAQEIGWPRDLKAYLEGGHFEPPPHNALLGPVRPRGPANGLLLHRGVRAAAWGETTQADQVFSVAKSFLSLLAGLAVADGRIPDLDRPVRESVDDGGFEGPHNGAVTWRHLLTLTSEWQGELFGKADTVDHNRSLNAEGSAVKGLPRTLQPPGTFWEYNDVRVNRLSLALMRVFGRTLVDILASRIMRPIGASDDWLWEGYETSWVEVGGLPMQAVPGGTHWGGGITMHAADMARVGQLTLQDGVWEGRRILPEGWVAASTTPCPLNRSYGLLWWLNAEGKWPSLPRDSFAASGAGGNLIWICPSRQAVAVLRWTEPAMHDAVLARLLAALPSG